MPYEQLTYAADDRVATVTLNRPRYHNALSLQLIGEIMEAVGQADADPDVRVVVLTGAGGKAFSAGYDIKESAQAPRRGLPEWRARMQKDIKFTYSVWDCTKPVIAMIDGLCFAGALELAMCCDMRYCSDDATFAAIEARFSNGIATMIMPWILGQKARALIYTGDTIGADEAFRVGLVDKVFPKADLHAQVRKIALRMSRVSLDCLRWNKKAINHAFETMGLRNAIAYGAEASAIMDATGSPEANTFEQIRREQGLGPALAWRSAQFAAYE